MLIDTQNHRFTALEIISSFAFNYKTSSMKIPFRQSSHKAISGFIEILHFIYRKGMRVNVPNNIQNSASAKKSLCKNQA